MSGFLRHVAWCLFACVLSVAHARDPVPFVPPAERVGAVPEHTWDGRHFLTLAYHHIEDDEPDQTYLSVRTDKLIAQLAWLREHGYQAVSTDQILAARDGGPPLPRRAVYLTFDDGYASFYDRVFPILKAYRWPAVLAPVGAWLDTPAGQAVDYGGQPAPRKLFLTWEQVAEMSASGLVDIGSHTYNLHYGITANPQGNLQPAAAARRWTPEHGYEDDATYEARIRADVQRITARIREVTGKPPRVWVWPYGAASGSALAIVKEAGYRIALTLEDGLSDLDSLDNVPRFLLANDPPTEAFARVMTTIGDRWSMRVMHVDLDYVYDEDPAQMERNLGELIQRVADMRVSAVFLQAFADPTGDGLVRQTYFPNRWLPMRSDMFNRAAWQLRGRAGVREIYAWMPVLAMDMDPALPRVTRWRPDGEPDVDPDQYLRLSPFDPEVRRRITDVYEDLARYAMFDGVLFHDDALLSDFEDAGPAAAEVYRAAGLPDTVPALRADPATLQRWTRFKSRYLVDFTKELARSVRAIRGPEIKTARNIYAAPILEPESEAWFAQNLDDFLGAYDWTAPMAMPLMEGVPAARAGAWLDRLVAEVARRPGAMQRTVFELQSVDWRDPPDESKPIDSVLIAQWMKRLELRGVRHFGYYPDDFPQDHPRLDKVRPVMSNAWYPFP